MLTFAKGRLQAMFAEDLLVVAYFRGDTVNLIVHDP